MTAGTRRTIARAFLALLTVVVFAIGYERSVTRTNDFDSFYDAAASVWNEGALLQGKSTERYLPSFQVLLAPLGALPIEAAAAVWLALALASYGTLVWLFAGVFGVSPRAQVPAWLCVAPFVVSNVTLGQNGPLLLALSTAGVAASVRGRDERAGAALAVAGLFKVLPTALLVIPLGLGRIGRTVAGAALAGALVAGAMILAIGPDAAFHDSLRWVTEVRGEQAPHRLIESVRSLRYNNQGLAVTMARTFGDFSPWPQKAAPGSTQLLA
ncbi:MAG TPA: glycosyltransferase 87 family protein, partial [Myxococcota bacterium]|nr:glycosyltransferase 87 family protein [Myxococcota bacterium]